MEALNNMDGLVNLRNLVQEVKKTTTANKSVPIVFGLLVNEGYTVIVAPVAPLSSNWERACELYSQLISGRFSTINSKTTLVEEKYDLDVDYGNYFATDPAHAPEQTVTHHRRRAILFPNSAFPNDWKWDKDHKVHFICHSQGGNTVRYLISLLTGAAGILHPKYFSQAGRDNWIISVTTIGTPHRGTTIINTIESFLSRSRQQAVSLVARLFATASFYPQEKRGYDLQLDHWGIRRNPGETFQQMLLRLESVNGPVWRWLNSTNNGFYDNSIEGVYALSQHAINTSPHIIYFSLSFHATVPFPENWPVWGKDAIDSFPTSIESFVRGVTGNLPIIGALTGAIIDAFSNTGWKFLTTVTSFSSFVQWVTQDVITKVLQNLGYKVVLPKPGKYLPRKDVIPIMLLSAYAMGGQDLTQAQKDLLGPDLGDWYQNDGVVNTESMRGPGGAVKSISSLSDSDFSNPNKRGTYWHLGVNDLMDHADEIGVFVEEDTVRLQIPRS
ncbi:hypothetical protein CIB48_g1591 [Xylaria polymorpha]|nr:hypothetical protein CIB48_g1591 [Xylaria polymorpha]